MPVHVIKIGPAGKAAAQGEAACRT